VRAMIHRRGGCVRVGRRSDAQNPRRRYVLRRWRGRVFDRMPFLTSTADDSRETAADDFAWPPADEYEAFDLQLGQRVRVPATDDEHAVPGLLRSQDAAATYPVHTAWINMAAGAVATVLILASGYLIAHRVRDTQPSAANASEPPPHTNPSTVPRGEAPSAASAVDPQPTAGTAPAPGADAAARGWLSIALPFRAEVYERGRSLGASNLGRIPLSPGAHDLDLVSDSLNYQGREHLTIVEGQATFVRPAVPEAVLHVNANPWAEVLVDGQHIGETPLGNIQLTIGRHEITFRHPTLGEQRRTIVVAVGSANHLSVDLEQ